MANYLKRVLVAHPQSGVNLTVSTHSRTCSPSKTAGYIEKVTKGEWIPPLPYSSTVLYLGEPIALVKYYKHSDQTQLGDQYHQYGQWNQYLDLETPGLVSFGSLDARCIAKLYAKAPAYSTNVALIGAEASKTIGLVTSAATRLAKSYSRLKRFDVYGAFRALNIHDRRQDLKRVSKLRRGFSNGSKFASSAFLELSYGWKPLLSDVYNAAEDVAKRNQSKPHDIRLTASSKSSSNILASPSNLVAATGWGGIKSSFKVVMVGSAVKSRESRYVLYLRTVSPTKRTLAGLGLLNPLQVAWEVTPFSHIVDWFIPVGDYISSLTAFSGLALTKGVVSHFERERYFVQMTGSLAPSTSTSIQASIVGAVAREKDQVTFSRTTISSIPAFRPEKLADISGLSKGDRALKAIATLRQLI